MGKKYQFKLVEYEASSLCLPHFQFLLVLIKFLDKYKNRKFFRNFGYGTTYVIEKNKLQDLQSKAREIILEAKDEAINIKNQQWIYFFSCLAQCLNQFFSLL